MFLDLFALSVIEVAHFGPMHKVAEQIPEAVQRARLCLRIFMRFKDFSLRLPAGMARDLSTPSRTVAVTGKPSREPLIVLSILICGAFARFLIGRGSNDLSHFPGESHNVAVSLATTGRFADPFGYSSGPTAH